MATVAVRAGSMAAKQGAKQAIKVGAKQGAKQAAKQGAKQAAKQGAKQAAKQGAKQTVKTGAKQTAKTGAKQASKKGAKKGAKKTISKGSKQVSKVRDTGSGKPEEGKKAGKEDAEKEDRRKGKKSVAKETKQKKKQKQKTAGRELEQGDDSTETTTLEGSDLTTSLESDILTSTSLTSLNEGQMSSCASYSPSSVDVDSEGLPSSQSTDASEIAVSESTTDDTTLPPLPKGNTKMALSSDQVKQRRDSHGNKAKAGMLFETARSLSPRAAETNGKNRTKKEEMSVARPRAKVYPTGILEAVEPPMLLKAVKTRLASMPDKTRRAAGQLVGQDREPLVSASEKTSPRTSASRAFRSPDSSLTSPLTGGLTLRLPVATPDAATRRPLQESIREADRSITRQLPGDSRPLAANDESRMLSQARGLLESALASERELDSLSDAKASMMLFDLTKEALLTNIKAGRGGSPSKKDSSKAEWLQALEMIMRQQRPTFKERKQCRCTRMNLSTPRRRPSNRHRPSRREEAYASHEASDSATSSSASTTCWDRSCRVNRDQVKRLGDILRLLTGSKPACCSEQAEARKRRVKETSVLNRIVRKVESSLLRRLQPVDWKEAAGSDSCPCCQIYPFATVPADPISLEPCCVPPCECQMCNTCSSRPMDDFYNCACGYTRMGLN
ncbi:unnamed protein product [Protopolystoma xenopodis]|uniref:Uncharacterized protein n=1 Tax=Protopolystoma xenopodis TaxID=117903 RepID=A0A448XI38_9PLAT|nr:unnamed protein product [Protopolystoma xenopodis]